LRSEVECFGGRAETIFSDPDIEKTQDVRKWFYWLLSFGSPSYDFLVTVVHRS
jgi:hypothetical protein